MNKLGGYFELELRSEEEFHHNAIRLNSGRNALKYVFLVKGFKKIYIPYFTCDAVLEPIKALNIDYEFYRIREDFYPIFDFKKVNYYGAFVYTNYFGLMDEIVRKLSYMKLNLIVDNAQAFFSKPIQDIDTFYSPRKYFGIPDGGYLYTNKKLNIELDYDFSKMRISHLLTRIENGPESGYQEFIANEETFSQMPLLKMSKLTEKLLRSIDYSKVSERRRENYNLLNELIGEYNTLKLASLDKEVPLVYPFLCEKVGIREYLIEKGIFVARYWPNVLEWCDKDSIEYNYALNIVPLPIDQRVGKQDIETLERLIRQFENG